MLVVRRKKDQGTDGMEYQAGKRTLDGQGRAGQGEGEDGKVETG
jgi:hypothetical protein